MNSIHEAVVNERKRIAGELLKHLDCEEISSATRLSIEQVNLMYEERQLMVHQWLNKQLSENFLRTIKVNS